MNTRTALLAGLLALIPFASRSQTEVSRDPELGARLSFGLDKKVTRGLHLYLEEELRLDNNFTGFDRLQTTLGVTYKVHPNVKVGVGYAFIAPWSSSSSAFKSTRHRLMADVTGTLHFTQWNLSLKERLQYTRRAGSFNAYQNPTNAVGLKSRLTLKYKGWQPRGLEPYAFAELRNTFSGPTVAAEYNTTKKAWCVPGTNSTEGDEAGWFLDGFNSTYVNRFRLGLGMDIRLSRQGLLNVQLLADWVSDKVIDANKKGTVLNSYEHRTGFMASLCAGYTYMF